MTGYLTPAGVGRGEYDEKRSRFLGCVWPVATEEEARARIEETRKKYYDARHNCFCYILRSGTVRYGDDGEPQGTAGQPMLNVFQSEGLTDFCCVVTRYFGGVLLGAGGLVRAYTAAAKAALTAAGVREMALWREYVVPCPYPLYERVKRLLDAHEAVVTDTDYGADVRFSALLRYDRAEDFEAALTELSAGSIQAAPGGERFQGVQIR